MQGDTRNNDSNPGVGQPADPAANNAPSSIIATPEVPPSPQPPRGPLMSDPFGGPVPKSHKKSWIILVIVLLLLAGGAVWYFMFYKNSPQYSASDLPLKAQSATQRALCFVRLNHLDCTDADGNNRIRYDFQGLPTGENVTTLQASADQSEFVAKVDSQDDTAAPYQLFDKNLNAGQLITPPAGQSINMPTVSRDDKSVLMELATKDNNRQIYRYTIADGKFTQLTSEGLNMQPVETADGHIIFEHLEKNPGDSSIISQWTTFVMNGDGSDQHKLPGVTLTAGSEDAFYSYDIPTDTVYVYTVSGVNDSVVWYGKASELLAGKPANTLPANVWSSGIAITPLNNGHLLFSAGGGQATVISATSGKQTGTIPHYGSVVGWLDTASFKQSSPQQEGKYERLINLATVPQDLQVFLKQQFDAKDADCQKAGLTDGSEFIMDVQKVIRDAYAQTEESCGDGGAEFYYKDASDWKKAFGAQQIPDCATVNQFKFTKEIIPTCYSGSTEVPNQNP